MDKKLEKKLYDLSENLMSESKHIQQQTYEKLLELLNVYPDNLFILNCLAFHNEFNLNNFDEAERLYKKILEIDPNDKEATQNLETLREKAKEKPNQQQNQKQKPQKETKQKSEEKTINSTNIKSNNINWLPTPILLILKIIILGLFIYFLFPYLLFGYNDKNITNTQTYNLAPGPENILKINSPQDFNRMTKNQIYEIRKSFVKKSIFNTSDYQPSSEIFGGIVDGKPWWGINQIVCSPYRQKNFDRTKGLSAVSKYINNPNMLIAVMFPFNFPSESDRIGYCTKEYSKTIPYELLYFKDKNLIVAKYKIDKKILKSYLRWSGRDRKYFLSMTGLNAKDFGYNYAFAYNLKNIQMTETNNLSNEITTFTDYIHVGGSCKHPEGCNNLSPYQSNLDFELKRFPAEITIKLWKNKPLNQYVKADMYYKLVFKKL